MKQLIIRRATVEEFSAAIDWAAAEGWNPGVDDLAVFHDADPGGFMMGFEGDEPVSSISVIRYGASFGFLGFYIVRRDQRGKGAGLATWNEGMNYLEGRTIGLDGVVAQQHNYAKSGFVLHDRNIRHSGKLEIPPNTPSGIEVRPAVADDRAALVAYDARHFPVSREKFIRRWIFPASSSTRRHTLLASRDDRIAGFGTIRACRDGFKIGPLFADDGSVAEALLVALAKFMPGRATVSLDTPERNPSAVALALKAGLSAVFETARMYSGDTPDLPTEQIFGVTTFELG